MTYSPNDTSSYLARAPSTESKARALEAQQAALRDAIRAEVTDAALAYRNATANVEITKRRLDAAETAYRARKERYLVAMATTGGAERSPNGLVQRPARRRPGPGRDPSSPTRS